MPHRRRLRLYPGHAAERSQARRSGFGSNPTKIDTTLNYHAFFDGAQLGAEWQDSYVRDIRYGRYLGYSVTRAVSIWGHDQLDGVTTDPSTRSPRLLHTIELGARLVFGL